MQFLYILMNYYHYYRISVPGMYMQSILPPAVALQSPARYLGNEFGAVHKPWDSAEIRFSLTYPEIYEVSTRSVSRSCLWKHWKVTKSILVVANSLGMSCIWGFASKPNPDMLFSHFGKIHPTDSNHNLTDFYSTPVGIFMPHLQSMFLLQYWQEPSS